MCAKGTMTIRGTAYDVTVGYWWSEFGDVQMTKEPNSEADRRIEAILRQASKDELVGAIMEFLHTAEEA